MDNSDNISFDESGLAITGDVNFMFSDGCIGLKKPTEDLTAEEVVRKHCNIQYDKHTGEEIINSSLSAVIIAMEEYTKQKDAN